MSIRTSSAARFFLAAAVFVLCLAPVAAGAFTARVHPMEGDPFEANDFRIWSLGKSYYYFMGSWQGGTVKIDFDKVASVTFLTHLEGRSKVRLHLKDGSDEFLEVDNHYFMGETKLGRWKCWTDQLRKIEFIEE